MLKKLLLAAVATLAVSSAAHATYLCDKPTQLVGKSGTNPVVSTRVGVDTETKHWFVFHTLRDGTVIDRRLQYNMQFIPERPGADFGWSGFSTRNKDLWMFGAVRPSSQDGSTITYVEELHDQAHGNRLVMQSSAQVLPRKMQRQPGSGSANLQSGRRRCGAVHHGERRDVCARQSAQATGPTCWSTPARTCPLSMKGWLTRC